MAKFRSYEKVERWDHTDEIEGINIGTIHIQEKIDGANGQVFFSDDYIYVGKRSAVIGRANIQEGWPFEIKDTFREFPKLVFQDKAFRNFFKQWPELRLYGEWLVKHTIIYPQEFIKRFWIFDVYNNLDDKFLEFEAYQPMLEKFHLNYIPVIETIENPSMDLLLDKVRIDAETPKSSFGAEVIEGLVFKNYKFENRFGNNPYMKAVTKDFREIHHAIMGANRFDLPEVYIASKYLTVARMEKLYWKLLDEKKDSHLKMKDIPQFMERVYYDVISEDAWQIFGRDKKLRKAEIKIHDLRKIISAKAKNWFITKLQEEIK